MGMKKVNTAFLCLFISLVSGCASFERVSGSTVMLKGSPPAMTGVAEDVSIFLEKPEKPFKVIALVTSSVRMDDYASVAEGEGAALERLKLQAAFAGADGIINITREIMDQGTIVSSTSWTSATAFDGERRFPRSFAGTDYDYTSLYRYYSINFRGEAISFNK